LPGGIIASWQDLIVGPPASIRTGAMKREYFNENQAIASKRPLWPRNIDSETPDFSAGFEVEALPG
jgi:hypothetical protein